MIRLALAAVVAALVLVSMPLVAPAGAASTATNGPARATSYADQARAATNGHRTRRDLVALRRNPCLQRFAQRQAQRMANRQSMFHQDLGPVATTCGLSRAGENVAYGFSSGRAVVTAWMGSPGHRANILQPAYRVMAIGAVKKNGTWWVAQVFGRRA